MRKPFHKVFLFLSCLLVFSASAEKTVNVLTWWSYLDKPWLNNEVRKQCGVSLALQEYKDNNAFMRLFHQYHYDLAIFESTIYPFLQNRIPTFNSRLSDLYDHYTPFVRKAFFRYLDKPNTQVFYISDVVFLYNPANITISGKDTVASLISRLKVRADGGRLLVLNDPNMMEQIIKADLKVPMTKASFRKEFEYKYVTLADEFNDYRHLNAFITWSGEALLLKAKAKKEGINLKVITLPRYAFTSADFIAQLTKSRQAECVAHLIASPSIMGRLQNQVYYYSPYADFSSVSVPGFRAMYKNFTELGRQGNLRWVFPDSKSIEETQKQWQDISTTDGL